MASMMVLLWGMLLEHGLDLMEDLLMAGQVARSLEGFMYVLLVVSQMEILLVILVNIHREECLVQIVELREAQAVGCQMVVII